MTTTAEAQPPSITCDDRGCFATVQVKPRKASKLVRNAHASLPPTPVYSGSSLVEKARRYMGRTGPSLGLSSRLWCAEFMNMITGWKDPKAPRMAKSYLNRPRTSKRVGAIAVLSRRGGGHVGVVSGFDSHGNPIIISGNHGKRVGEAVYPQSRVLAYVS